MERKLSRKTQPPRSLSRGASTASHASVSGVCTPTSETPSSDFRAEPKSEYLRKALQDGREARAASTKPFEKKTSIPERSPSPSVCEERQTPSPVRNLPSPEPSFAGDEWTDEVLEQEPYLDRRSSNARARRNQRTSLNGLRSIDLSTPSRDNHDRLDRLEKENFNLKHRMTLQQEHVKQLVHDLEVARKEIQLLKRSEEQKDEENQQLEDEVDALTQELGHKKDVIQALWNEKTELFKLQEELTREMEKKDEAITEAAASLLQAEADLNTKHIESERKNAALEALRAEVICLRAKEIDSDYYSSTNSPERRARPKESTESKLSVSNSDYYSGENSPAVQSYRDNQPKHLIPPEFIPERRVCQWSSRARQMIQNKAGESERIQELRRRCSYATEAASSLVDLLDNDNLHAIDSISHEQSVPENGMAAFATSDGSPRATREYVYRPRMAVRGLRALYNEGEPSKVIRKDAVHDEAPTLSSLRPQISPYKNSPSTVTAPPPRSASVGPAISLAVKTSYPEVATAVEAFRSYPRSPHLDAEAAWPEKSTTIRKPTSRPFVGNSALKESLYPPFSPRGARDLFFNPNADLDTTSPGSPSHPTRPQSRTRKGFGHE